MQRLRDTVLIRYTRANICGVEFTSGERIDGGRSGRCGSLVTCVIHGQSVYGRVIHFVKRLCDSNTNNLFAYIEWFPVPEYPMDGTPLIVKVGDNAPPNIIPPLISIFDIDPSRIINERDDNELCYYMCRIEGLDTVLRRVRV